MLEDNLIPGSPKKLLHFATANMDRRLKHWMLRKINDRRRQKQFAYILEHHPINVSVQCPICHNDQCRTVTYYFEQNRIEKALCPECHHLFSFLNLPENIPRARELFDYDAASLHSANELLLIKLLIKCSGKASGRFLDFGVGGNRAVLQSARSSVSDNYQIWGCDLIHREDTSQYFITYQDDAMLGSFDGICSSEVMEHLDNTIEAWTYMNRLLRPVNGGGGVMLHSFPSNVTLHLQDTMIIIGSHICLFSDKSLRLLCEKTGFQLKCIRHDHFFPEFLFVKTGDI
jgi:predicted Zn-ribbon and HTH transcriptional regulator